MNPNSPPEKSYVGAVDPFHVAHVIDNPRYRLHEQKERAIFEEIERRYCRARRSFLFPF